MSKICSSRQSTRLQSIFTKLIVCKPQKKTWIKYVLKHWNGIKTIWFQNIFFSLTKRKCLLIDEMVFLSLNYFFFHGTMQYLDDFKRFFYTKAHIQFPLNVKLLLLLFRKKKNNFRITMNYNRLRELISNESWEADAKITQKKKYAEN